jgi:ABC-type branched-subunit amino acid transport system ATPase component
MLGASADQPGELMSTRSNVSMLLDVKNLAKRFDGICALDGISFGMRPGEVLGLIGPNGAGKSVLQSCIGGALRADAGEIWIADVRTDGWTPERLCRHGVSRTFQLPQPFSRMTVYEAVLVGARFGRGSRTEFARARERAEAALDLVDFPKRYDTPVAALTLTEFKRVDLARAIACGPQLLMVDEVAAGLMGSQVDALVYIIRGLADRGVGVLMIEHVVRSILTACDRVIAVDRGKLIADGLPRDVVANTRVLAAYLGPRSNRDAQGQ